MVKHTQTVRRPMNCLSVFGHFWGLAIKELRVKNATYSSCRQLEEKILILKLNRSVIAKE